MSKSAFLQIRCSPTWKERVRRAAETSGLELTEVVLEAVNEWLRRQEANDTMQRPDGYDAATLKALGLYEVRQAGYARRLEARREFQAGEGPGTYPCPYPPGSLESIIWNRGAHAASEALEFGWRFAPCPVRGGMAVVELATAEPFPALTFRVHDIAQRIAAALNTAPDADRPELLRIAMAELARIREECRRAGAAEPVVSA